MVETNIRVEVGYQGSPWLIGLSGRASGWWSGCVAMVMSGSEGICASHVQMRHEGESLTSS